MRPTLGCEALWNSTHTRSGVSWYAMLVRRPCRATSARAKPKRELDHAAQGSCWACCAAAARWWQRRGPCGPYTRRSSRGIVTGPSTYEAGQMFCQRMFQVGFGCLCARRQRALPAWLVAAQAAATHSQRRALLLRVGDQEHRISFSHRCSGQPRLVFDAHGGQQCLPAASLCGAA